MLDKSIDEYEINNCMYIAGSDRNGRPILVFIGKWFQSKNFSTEKAVLYLIKILHSVVSKGQDYVVIYFHTKTTKDNVPSYAWIKDVYFTLGYDYKKRLKSFYVVHPTLWTKMTCCKPLDQVGGPLCPKPPRMCSKVAGLLHTWWVYI